MKPTQRLHELGQSLWLDNITRDMLGDGTLRRYIDELSITGLTSNPTIFDKAISAGDAYDEHIIELHERGPGAGAGVLRARAGGPPRRGANVRADQRAHRRRRRLGLARGLPAARRRRRRRRSRRSPSFTRGPARQRLHQDPRHRRRTRGDRGVDLRGHPGQRDAALLDRAVPWRRRGVHARVERRIEAGLDPAVPSVASIFVSRWDVAVADEVPAELRNRLGIAVATHAYRAYRELLDSERWQRLANEGARPQRLLFASTGTKDPDASDTLYVEALAAPFTVNTMPDRTLLAFADHGEVGDPLPADGGDAEQVLDEFEAAGVDVAELAARLQREGAEAFDESWNELLQSIERRAAKLAATG